MKNLTLLFIAFLICSKAYTQFGINGGASVLLAFGTPKPYVGLHIGAEVPRDDQVSIYGKLSLYSKQTTDTKSQTFAEAIDMTTTVPAYQTVMYNTSMNYTMIEGGNRFYIGEGYDSGFGAYGGGILLMIFNSVKREYDEYDESKYRINQNEPRKGSIFNLGFGLGGGVKNTFPGIGTFYLDANFSYLILSTASNATAQASPFYRPLLFSFNLGFRKDLY